MLWGTLAEVVSKKYKYTVDEDVKLYFTIHNAMFDSGICCWENKYYYDYVRPITAIRNLGDIPILVSLWHPYQELTQPTPPFPEYGSGHSTFGSSWAEVMKRFIGSDDFQAAVTIDTLAFEGKVIDPPVTLYWETFSDAAAEAGISRLYGGIHFMDGNLNAQAQGRKIGALVYEKAQSLFQGEGSSSVTGGGWFWSPPGAYMDDEQMEGKAHFSFAFHSLSGSGESVGQMKFRLKSEDLNFRSTRCEEFIVMGSRAVCRGTGMINDWGNFGFMLSAYDADRTSEPDDVDMIHLKIWDRYDSDRVIYDNQIPIGLNGEIKNRD